MISLKGILQGTERGAGKGKSVIFADYDTHAIIYCSYLMATSEKSV